MYVSCIGSGFSTTGPPGEPPFHFYCSYHLGNPSFRESVSGKGTKTTYIFLNITTSQAAIENILAREWNDQSYLFIKFLLIATLRIDCKKPGRSWRVNINHEVIVSELPTRPPLLCFVMLSWETTFHLFRIYFISGHPWSSLLRAGFP